MAKVILLSQFPLPYAKIGSWTTMYQRYLSGDNNIDIVICPKPAEPIPNLNYTFTESGFVTRLKKKIYGKSYAEYLNPLKKVIKPNEKYIIQIIDNPGLATHLSQFLIREKLYSQCYLQFFHHGFSPFYNVEKARPFFEHVHEMVMLTHASYLDFKRFYAVLPCRFSVLHNGIDLSNFNRPAFGEKALLKKKLGIDGKTVFLWCSQDRKKKGLDLILDVWKRIYRNNPDTVLLVIGSKRETLVDGVQFLGRMPNSELPEYYQASDVYLFPTLWHEGFGMSLIEAMHCGCYCIASALGGVPEVLQNGALGKLIENPHYINEWVEAIEEYLKTKPEAPIVPGGLYSIESWKDGMNRIIDEAKLNLE